MRGAFYKPGGVTIDGDAYQVFCVLELSLTRRLRINSHEKTNLEFAEPQIVEVTVGPARYELRLKTLRAVVVHVTWAEGGAVELFRQTLAEEELRSEAAAAARESRGSRGNTPITQAHLLK